MCIFFRSKELLCEFGLNKIQIFILRAASRRRLGNGEQRYFCVVPHRGRRHAVKHRKARAINDIQLVFELPSAAACVCHISVYLFLAQIQLRASMNKKLCIFASGEYAVDACRVLRHCLIAHTLAHLARHVAYHILSVWAAAFIHIGRAVGVIYPVEFIYIQNASCRAGRN